MDVLILVVRVLLIALLYVFLVAVLFVVWNDLRRSAFAPPVEQVRKARLVVQASADGIEPGKAWPLQAFTMLGRGPANTIIVPDTFASAEHALISWRGGQWWLEDLGSRNGTRLNDLLVTTPTVLSAGDVISIGQVNLKIEIEP